MPEHLAKRKELWEARKNTGATCTSITGPGQPKRFASETSEKTGVNKSTVNRAVSRADRLCAAAVEYYPQRGVV